MFQTVDAYAGDPILSLMERFKEDPRSDKVNLSIGLYYNEDGIIPQLKAVAEAEARLNAVPHGASLYLPMEGLNAYRNTIAPLLFGADHAVLAQQRVATIQTLGGSGALKVGADFLKKYFPDSGVWVSDPTWENHVAIFEGAGFKVATYPWFDSETNGVRVEALLEKLNTLPERSIVLLHPCCHNPTGADLTHAQWDAVIEVLKARNLIPFLDIAYQGFGAGMEDDAYAIRAVASAGLPALVSNSFSKIFSLYGERVYRTGDSAMLTDEGDLVFCGRKDNQIKYRGHRIELEEIDKAFEGFSDVDRCRCAFDSKKNRLCAFYEGTACEKELPGRAASLLPAFMRPTRIAKVPSMPLNKNGKVDRAMLLESHGEPAKRERADR